MKRIATLALAILLSYNAFGQSEKTSALDWFQEAKFGVLLTWGLYSETAGVWKGIPSRGGEHFMLYERVSLKDYGKIAEDFNPTDFNAEQWVKQAKYAGMKYLIYMAKHHDGFSMYDTKVNDYNIVKMTPFKRDPLAEIAEACRKYDMKLGIYYSLGRDWEDPDVPTRNGHRSNIWDYPNESAKDNQRYMERKVYPQLRELLTNYGDIAIMWFDTYEMTTKAQSHEIVKLIDSIQPDCLVNGRVGDGLGDYAILEQKLADKIIYNPWELCITMGKNWCYNIFDVEYKTPEMLIRHLIDVVSKGGNLLLGIGPTGKGVFPTLTYPGLEAFHYWLKENSEAIYGTSHWRVFGENYSDMVSTEKIDMKFHDAVYDGTPKENTPDIRFTIKNNILYIIVRSIKDQNFIIKSILPSDNVKKVTLLENGAKVNWKSTDKGLEVTIPERSPLKLPVYTLKAILK
ncbi:alpha-L-fucosidase [Parabacteroides segnis]|uniref:alpha-L-fucosidase n=1 Tax=Parabacteroides segnis TaxID=2763058 RepID=UPI0035185B01